MEKSQLWGAFASKNPQFNGDGNVTMSAAGLRKLFEQTWEKGRENGFANGKAHHQMEEMKAQNKKSPFGFPL